VTGWSSAMTGAGAAVQVHMYRVSEQLFNDPDVPEYDKAASQLVWQSILASSTPAEGMRDATLNPRL